MNYHTHVYNNSVHSCYPANHTYSYSLQEVVMIHTIVGVCVCVCVCVCSYVKENMSDKTHIGGKLWHEAQSKMMAENHLML